MSPAPPPSRHPSPPSPPRQSPTRSRGWPADPAGRGARRFKSPARGESHRRDAAREARACRQRVFGKSAVLSPPLRAAIVIPHGRVPPASFGIYKTGIYKTDFIAPSLPFQGDQAVDAHAARAPAPEYIKLGYSQPFIEPTRALMVMTQFFPSAPRRSPPSPPARSPPAHSLTGGGDGGDCGGGGGGGSAGLRPAGGRSPATRRPGPGPTAPSDRHTNARARTQTHKHAHTHTHTKTRVRAIVRLASTDK